MAYAITHVEPAPLRDLLPGLPADLAHLVDGCLRKDPAERHPGVEPLLRALQPWAGTADATVVLERTAGRRLQADAEGASPYPGLASFTEKDAEYFHGRESQVEAVWQKLRRGRLLAVAGPSGVGKTSFLRAGLIAARPRGWGVLVATPGGSPLLSLREALVRELSGDTEAMVSLVRENDPDTDVAMVRRWRQRHDEALVAIDQFEELFTLSRPEEQARFAALLSRLTFEADVRVLVSLRDDFLHRCRDHAGLAPVFESLTMLGPLTGADLRRALLQPAEDCGYRFEDESLADEMMAQVEGERGALPLLAFAMAGLWAGRDRARGLLTRQAHEQLGGVTGALAQHAEAVMERVGEARHGLVREVFRNLVTGHETRAVVEREQLLSVFGGAEREAAAQVLGELIDARLLTSYEVKGEDGRGSHRLEIIHESLLSAWPRLVRWRTQDADGAQLRDQLRQAAQLWKERSESPDLLWTGTAYQEFALWRERYPGGLTADEEAFARAMAARAQRRRRRRRLAVTAVVTAAAMVAVATTGLWQRSAAEKRRAEASELVALGRVELADNPTAALAYAIASLDCFDSPLSRHFALEALSRGPLAGLRPFAGGMTQACATDFSPDGRHLAVGTHSGVLVLSRDGSPAVVLEDFHDGWARFPAFGPDSDRVVWRDTRDGRVLHVWSLAAGREVRRFEVDQLRGFFVTAGRLFLLHRVTDSPRAGTFTNHMSAWSFDEGDPEPVASWVGPDVQWLYCSPDGRSIAYTLTKDRSVYFSALAEFSGLPGRRLGEHRRQPYYPWFDPSGQRVATADSSGEIRIWAVAAQSQEPLQVLRGEGPVHLMRFDPSGTRLAAVCGPRKTVHIWDLAGPRDAAPVVLRFPYQNRNVTYTVSFDPTGNWLVEPDLEQLVFWPVERQSHYLLRGTVYGFAPNERSLIRLEIDRTGGGSWAHRLMVTDLEGGPSRELESGTSVASVALSADGTLAAVGGGNRGARLVSLTDMEKTPREIPRDPSRGEFQVAAVNADGTLVAGLGPGKDEVDLRLWRIDADSARVLWTSRCGGFSLFAFSAAGGLYSGDLQGNLNSWDLSDGSGTLLAKNPLPYFWGMAITPDSRHLITGLSRSVTADRRMTSELTVFDLENGTSRLITAHGNKVSAVALDATGARLVTGDADGFVRIGPVTGGEPHLLLGQEFVNLIAVSPDGRWIASSSQFEPDHDATLRLWRTPEGRPLQTLPHGEFLDHLRAQTNLRVVPDALSPTGYRVDTMPFTGWAEAPLP